MVPIHTALPGLAGFVFVPALLALLAATASFTALLTAS